MLKYRIEGFSTVSMDDALAQAMTKAAAFASQDHDMHIAVLELTELPDRGFKAVVEVTIIPITFRETLHREAADVELKRINDEDYRARKKFDETHVKKEVEAHFLRTSGMAPYVPDVFLAHMDDSQLKNFLIEKQFYNMFRQSTDWQPITDMTVLAALNTVLPEQTPHHIQHEDIGGHTLTIDNQKLDDMIETEFDHATHAVVVNSHPAANRPEPVAAPGVRPPHPGPGGEEEA